MGDNVGHDASGSPRQDKTLFVTVGATAPFDGLVRAILEPKFLQALRNAKYTHLQVQHGYEREDNLFTRLSKKAEVVDFCNSSGLRVTGFGFDKNGLDPYMRGAKGFGSRGQGTQGTSEGAVMSHAGSGSILDALRTGVPLIVVPNDGLLHEHQLELAVELAKQEYVVHGKLETLPTAIPDVEKLRTRMKQWPPVNSGESKYKKGLAGVMDDEMGWVD